VQAEAHVKTTNPGPAEPRFAAVERVVGPTSGTSTRGGAGQLTGRVGALAVSLGIGAAVLAGPGLAFAGTGGTGPAGGGATTSSDPDGPGAAPSATTVGNTPSADPPGRKSRSPSHQWGEPAYTQRNKGKRSHREAQTDADPSAQGALDATRPVISTDTAVSTRKQRDPRRSRAERAAAVHAEETANETQATTGPDPVARNPDRRRSQPSVAVAEAGLPDPPVRESSVTETASSIDFSPAVELTAVEKPATVVRALAAPPASDSRSTDAPVSPLRAGALIGALQLLRRQLEDSDPATPSTAGPTAAAGDGAGPAAQVAVTPLATADQLAAEKLATRIVRSPIVRLAKVILKVGWLITGYQKFAAVGGPDCENLKRLDRAVDEYALQAALELQLLNSHNPKVIQMVMPPHTWFGQTFGGARILYDNPDTVYRMIPVNYGSSYVITGQFTGPLPADTTFSVLTGLTGTTTAVLSTDELVRDAEGRFTITLDARATNPDNPNHLQLPAGATLIAARNTLADWNTEVPMTLDVQRVGGPPDNLFNQLGLYAIPGLGPLFTSNRLLSRLASAIPALSPVPRFLRNVETAIVMMLGLVMEPQYMAVATEDADTGKTKAPNTLSEPSSNASFLATQLQSAGYFQLADDEALVITIDRGNAGYFNAPVTDVWTITDNYWDEQTSLNSFQAVPDTEGGSIYTVVVSPTDPQVANWVSTGGLNQGTLSIRFQDLDPESSNTPRVSATVVKVADVLPPGAEPFTADDRAAQIALRQSGYNTRYAPYPQTTH
jgi:hypothetical protein